MKQIKFGILGIAVIGLIAIFLPYVKIGPESISFWKVREAPEVGAQPIIALVGFLLAAAMGGMAVAKKALLRWQAIVATVGFGLAFLTGGVREGMSSFMGISTAIGGKLLFLSAILGIAVSIAGIVKPEKA